MYSLPLNLHNFSISHSLDISFGVFLVEEIMRIDNTPDTFSERKGIKLLFNRSRDDEVYIFYLFVLGLDCCAFCE